MKKPDAAGPTGQPELFEADFLLDQLYMQTQQFAELRAENHDLRAQLTEANERAAKSRRLAERSQSLVHETAKRNATYLQQYPDQRWAPLAKIMKLIPKGTIS